MRAGRFGVLVGAIALLASCVSTKPSFQNHGSAIVIAHRGASGYLPEHTIAGYELAIKQGADFIEPDLVMTKDGVLVARHDPYLSDSTDVADHLEFADRKTTVVSPEGEELTDWFVWDFTLAELKTLRARQVREGRNKAADGQHTIPTFGEILALSDLACKTAKSKPSFGFYPELKWPSAHKARGFDMAGAFKAELARSTNYNICKAPLIVQSFEDWILKDLKNDGYFVVQLVFPVGWVPGAQPSYTLEHVATYADGVGPYYLMLLDLETKAPNGYAERAASLGLDVHIWTMRDDALDQGFSSIDEQIKTMLDAGATGVFADFPDTARRVVDDWNKEHKKDH